MDEIEVVCQVVRREAWMAPPWVGLAQARRILDLGGQQASPERRVGHEGDVEFSRRNQRFFGLDPIQQRVFVLHRGDLMNAVGPANSFWASLAEAEKAHLAALDESRHGPYRLFDRHSWIDAVLIIQIDHVDTQALKARLACADHILRPAVGYLAPTAGEIAEFGRDKDLGAAARNRLANQHLVVPKAVHVGGVEQRHSTVDRFADQLNASPVVAGAVY